MISVLRESEKELDKLTFAVPLLIDFSDSFANQEFMDAVTVSGKKYDHLISKSAILGITGIKKVLMNAYYTLTGQRNRSKNFDKKTDAMDFLYQ